MSERPPAFRRQTHPTRPVWRGLGFGLPVALLLWVAVIYLLAYGIGTVIQIILRLHG